MSIKKIIYYPVIILFACYVIWVMSLNWQQVASFNWQFNLTDALLTVFFLIPIYFINVLGWHFILRLLGESVTYRQNLRIWTFSNLARFIPGSVWQYPSRILMLKELGLSKRVSTTAVFLEFLFNLAIGLFLTAVLIQFLIVDEDIKFFIQNLALISFCGLLVVLFFLNNFRQTFLTLLKKSNLEISSFRPKFLPIIVILVCLSFILGGASLFFLTKNAISMDFSLIIVFIGIYTMSWLLGYLVIIAPGGLGVQDIAMSILLGNYIPLPVALVIIVVFRIILYIAEFLSLMIGFIGNRNR